MTPAERLAAYFYDVEQGNGVGTFGLLPKIEKRIRIEAALVWIVKYR